MLTPKLFIMFREWGYAYYLRLDPFVAFPKAHGLHMREVSIDQ